MRFAISLLTLVCIVSVIGTVVEQHQPELSYIDKFGTFWYQVFVQFDIGEIYNAPWFLFVMGIVVVSTSICLIRNVPKMIKEMRNFREYVREQNLRAFPHRFQIQSERSVEGIEKNVLAWLGNEGYRYKIRRDDTAIMVGAKKGSSNKWGYIFAHLAIVVVCLGGLLDSELPLKLQILLGQKTPIPQSARYVSEVPSDAIFGVNNISFRGNVSLSEGAEGSDFALLRVGGNLYLQQLPFSVKLNRFIVEYYEYNGMPKRFASEVTITDAKTGKQYDETIEVNHPFTLHGITLYQNSFQDGGSKVWLEGYPLIGQGTSVVDVSGTVGQDYQVDVDEGRLQYRLNIDDFRLLNVENLGGPNDATGHAKTFTSDLKDLTGSAARERNPNIRNLGPSIRYTLTDKNNQSVQFMNYMLPVVGLEPIPVFLFGVQNALTNNMMYIRVPADEKGSIQQFLLLRKVLNDPNMREKAVNAFVEKNQDSGKIPKEGLRKLASQALTIYANAGFAGIEDYINGVGIPESQRVPETLRGTMREVLQNYLVFSIIELNNIVRQEMGWEAVAMNDEAKVVQEARWLDLAMNALSDFTHYPSPIIFQLKSFKRVQGSVLQATRSPGEVWVYLGCIMLALGVFAMFYIRERRVWVYIKSGHPNQITVAMTSPKRTMDFEKEFNQLRQDFRKLGSIDE
ncbi:hypothetical protein IX83_01090 [Basilea psittacipulmonis DSM 24701]|uniref:ResB-like domain-containing protein n=2 Tax=Basilea TaxID=1472344 RepID=A0A077DBR5_9BURK|nr:hypothetical protein IX83_01090 [Basilea psittacipulmonis DSM 24701]